MCLNLQIKKRGDLTNNKLQDKHDQTKTSDVIEESLYLPLIRGQSAPTKTEHKHLSNLCISSLSMCVCFYLNNLGYFTY